MIDARLRVVGLGVDDEQERDEPERLEEQVERHEVAGEHDAQHRSEHDEADRVVAVALLLVLQVVERVQRGGRTTRTPVNSANSMPNESTVKMRFPSMQRDRAPHAMARADQRDERGGAEQRQRGHEHHVRVARGLAALRPSGRHERGRRERPEHEDRRQRAVRDVRRLR